VTQPGDGLEPGTLMSLRAYRVFAYLTGVFLVLLTVNLVLKYVLDSDGIGDWIAVAHGWLYLAYVLISVDLWFRTRLPFGRMCLVVVAGTVPLASFFAERWVTPAVRALGTAPAGYRSEPTGERT
jgi:integral membrane protein